MNRLFAAIWLALVVATLTACEKNTTGSATPPTRAEDASLLDASITIAPSTVAQKLEALSELGVPADASGLGETIRLDPKNPSIGGVNSGNYMILLDTTHSTHQHGGFVTLLPPYERTAFGETTTRLPRVVLRLDSKNVARLVDCGGNGPEILKFTLRQGSNVSAPLSESVVTSTNGHWYFAIPASSLTGFPNSMYLTISQDPDNPPTSPPVDVRFTGCDITSVS